MIGLGIAVLGAAVVLYGGMLAAFVTYTEPVVGAILRYQRG